MSSPSAMPSKSTSTLAVWIIAACVCETPLGLPVVPEVYRITATSEDRPFSISSPKISGLRSENSRPLRFDLEQLVALLLVLGDGEFDLGVLHYERHFGRHGVLVERHGHAAQGLRRHHRPVQPRAVVPDDRKAVAALEALCGKAAGEQAHFVCDLRPGPSLPYTQVLFAERRPVGPHLRLMQQQARESVGLFGHGTLLGSVPRQVLQAVSAGESYSR